MSGSAWVSDDEVYSSLEYQQYLLILDEEEHAYLLRPRGAHRGTRAGGASAPAAAISRRVPGLLANPRMA